MSTTFKKGNQVKFTSSRTGDRADGKIVEVIETLRGLWYRIKTTDGREIKVRGAELQLA
jgi:hypothetical protein